MEYFIGSVVTIVLIGCLMFFTRKLPQTSSISIKTSQSYLFSLIGKNIMIQDIVKSSPTQATKYLETLYVKVLVIKDKAYWIKDNVFYVADVVDNEINKESTKEVDTMSMDKVQLEEVMLIIDKLKEDSYNDNWNPGQ